MTGPTHLDGKHFERLARNINPGGWSVETLQPLATLLGSCVAVCFFDPLLRMGGMNHFLLPSRFASDQAETDAILYGDYAMEVVVNALLNRGARKDRLVAKAFGGGTVIDAIKTEIGERNAAFAKEWLAREGIPLVASDLGGPWSRKIVFIPQTGEAFCRRIPVTLPAVAAIIEEERGYERSLLQTTSTNEKKVELF